MIYVAYMKMGGGVRTFLMGMGFRHMISVVCMKMSGVKTFLMGMGFWHMISVVCIKMGEGVRTF